MISSIFSNLTDTIVGQILLFLGLVFLIYLITYIFKAIALHRMVDTHKWVSYIPVINNLTLSKVAFNNYYIGFVIVILEIISVYCDCIGEFGTIPKILVGILFIMYQYTAYCIYKKYAKNYILLTFLSILTCGLAIPFILFIIRKNEYEKSN